MSHPVDDFYPLSDAMRKCPHGMWQVGMVVKLSDHLANAKAGSKDSESRLCNRLGQLRRNVEFSCLQTALVEAVTEAITWLRSTGRTVDFKQEDPTRWITTRDGKTPRW